MLPPWPKERRGTSQVQDLWEPISRRAQYALCNRFSNCVQHGTEEGSFSHQNPRATSDHHKRSRDWRCERRLLELLQWVILWRGHWRKWLFAYIWTDSRAIYWRGPQFKTSQFVTVYIGLSEICKWGICCLQIPKRPKRYWACFNIVGIGRLCCNFLTASEIQKPSAYQVILRNSTGVAKPWTMYRYMPTPFFLSSCVNICMSSMNMWNESLQR